MRNEVKRDIQTIMENHNDKIEIHTLVEKSNYSEDLVLQELKQLLKDGQVGFDSNWSLDGKGKTYTEGLTED